MSRADEPNHLRVHESWRLRNDGSYVVAYECGPLPGKHRVLSVAEASITPFLDGSQSDKALSTIWRKLYGDSQRAEALLESTVESLSERLGIVARRGGVSPSLQHDSAHVLPDLKHYDAASAQHRLARPLMVTVVPTERCTTQCCYCYAERKPCPEASVEQWCTVLDELRENEIFKVDLGGGDPFVRRDVLELLREMVAREFVFLVSTKSHLSADLAEALAELGIGTDNAAPHLHRPLQLSIDSADSDVAAMLVDRPQHLEGMSASVGHLRRAGVTPWVKTVVTAHNREAPIGVVRHFAELGVRQFVFSPYYRSYYRHDDGLLLSREDKLRLADVVADLQDEYPSLTVMLRWDSKSAPGSGKDLQQWRARSFCTAGRTDLWIKANGDATACEQAPHTPAFVFGNVLQDGLVNTWNSQALQEFIFPARERLAGTQCDGCVEFESCHRGKGYCYRDAFFSSGRIHGPPPDCPFQDSDNDRRP